MYARSRVYSDGRPITEAHSKVPPCAPWPPAIRKVRIDPGCSLTGSPERPVDDRPLTGQQVDSGKSTLLIELPELDDRGVMKVGACGLLNPGHCRSLRELAGQLRQRVTARECVVVARQALGAGQAEP